MKGGSRTLDAQRKSKRSLEDELEATRQTVRELASQRDGAMRMLIALVMREGRVMITREELAAANEYDGVSIQGGVLGVNVSAISKARGDMQ